MSLITKPFTDDKEIVSLKDEYILKWLKEHYPNGKICFDICPMLEDSAYSDIGQHSSGVTFKQKKSQSLTE